MPTRYISNPPRHLHLPQRIASSSQGFVAFNSTSSHVRLGANDLPVCDTAILPNFACSKLGILLLQELLKATSTSTVVQFSFVSSSGFRGAAAATGSHSVHPADCWVHERQRSFFQRFATFVPLVSVFTPVSGSTVVNDEGFPPMKVHLVFSAEMVSEGVYLQPGCVQALPGACVSRSSFEFCWDFALLRSVDGGRCVASQCKCIYFAANTDTAPTVERACRSYHSDDLRVFHASTPLGARLLQSELVQKCAKRLQLAVASVLDCNATETIEWGIPVPLQTSGYAALAVRSEDVWHEATRCVRCLNACIRSDPCQLSLHQ